MALERVKISICLFAFVCLGTCNKLLVSSEKVRHIFVFWCVNRVKDDQCWCPVMCCILSCFFPSKLCVCTAYAVLSCVSKLLMASVLVLKCVTDFTECPCLEKLYIWRRDVYQFVWLKNKILWNLAFEF